MSSRLLQGAPSAPSETETPRSSISATGATPEPSFKFEEGQCAACVPVLASKSISRSLTWTQCASTTCGPVTPTDSRYSALPTPGRLPTRAEDLLRVPDRLHREGAGRAAADHLGDAETGRGPDGARVVRGLQRPHAPLEPVD